MTSSFVEAEAQRLAERVLSGRDPSQTWQDAGYVSATEAATALVGDGGDADVRARAIEIVAVEIE